jgi:hypothetical protein
VSSCRFMCSHTTYGVKILFLLYYLYYTILSRPREQPLTHTTTSMLLHATNTRPSTHLARCPRTTPRSVVRCAQSQPPQPHTRRAVLFNGAGLVAGVALPALANEFEGA